MMLKPQAFINVTTTLLKYFASLSASLVLTPVLAILLGVLAVYRQLVKIILKILFRNRFGGLLGGADVVHTMEEPCKAIISCLLIVGYDKRYDSKAFYENMIAISKKFWFGKPDSYPKFKSSFLKAMGYSYMRNDQITPDECIKKIRTVHSQENELNKTELLQVVADCCNAPLPRNNKVLWEMLIGTQPVKWKGDVTKNYYPILFRVHHGVADGVSLLKLLIGVFADSPTIEIVTSTEYKQTVPEHKSLRRYWAESLIKLFVHVRYFLRQFFTGVHILVVYPAVCFTQLVLKCNDSSILHGPRLTGQKVLALTTEETEEYVQKIKRIKNKFAGASFSDIVLTAYSASLRDYYIKKSIKRPKIISSLVPVLPGSLELQHMIPGQLNENSITFKNGYSFILPTLPLFTKFDENKTPLFHRLRLIQKEMVKLKHSIEYKINYFMMCVVGGIIPQPAIRLILKGSHCTTLVSIIAGPREMTFGGRVHQLQSLAFWVPHVKNIGVSFSVLTYANRLHVGLSADKALISQQSDAQSIVDGVFKYIDALEDEIDSNKLTERTD